jgi:putative hydrolase of the HAD superfamily
MPGPPAQALLIDGLGTLVELAPPAPALRHELAIRFDLDISEAEAGRALAAEIGFYRVRMGLGRDADSLSALRRDCAGVLRDTLPERVRRQADRLSIAAVTDALLSSLRFEPFSDARDALLAARRGGARVVVVSNWDISLLEVLERVGLAPLLDAVVTSAAVGAAKPAPAIFRHALALAAVAPEAALHVGDNLAEDVQGALACGIRAVLLRRDGSPADPPAADGVPTITSLAQLHWS